MIFFLIRKNKSVAKAKIFTAIFLMISWLVIYFYFDNIDAEELYALYVLGFCVIILVFISFFDLKNQNKYKRNH
jgi:hypothetical protein